MEAMAADICKSRGLYSPVYEYAKRNGCWFCPNIRKAALLHMYLNHRDLWNVLLKMQDTPDLAYPYWARGKTLYDVQAELEKECQNLVQRETSEFCETCHYKNGNNPL